MPNCAENTQYSSGFWWVFFFYKEKTNFKHFSSCFTSHVNSTRTKKFKHKNLLKNAFNQMKLFLTSSLKMRACSSQPIRFCTNLKTWNRTGGEASAAQRRERVRARLPHLIDTPRCNLLSLNALDSGQQLAVLLPAQRQRAVRLRAQGRQEQWGVHALRGQVCGNTQTHTEFWIGHLH